jgi:hypothetical protein
MSISQLLVPFDHFTQLMAQENFIKFSHCETFKPYMIMIIQVPEQAGYS